MIAGWFIVYGFRRSDKVDKPPRKTWHYFDTGKTASRCGGARRFQTSLGSDGPVERIDQLSSVGLTMAGFCRSCDRTRRHEEGR